MLKHLHGLFFYKLQFTSFFSILQRISGFFLIFLIFFSFFFSIFLGFFSFFILVPRFFIVFALVSSFLFFFYFIFHLISGLRIYYLSSFYFNVFNTKIIGLNLDFLNYLSLKFPDLYLKSNFGFFNFFLILNIKKLLRFYVFLATFFRKNFITSKVYFLLFIGFFYIIFLALGVSEFILV